MHNSVSAEVTPPIRVLQGWRVIYPTVRRGIQGTGTGRDRTEPALLALMLELSRLSPPKVPIQVPALPYTISSTFSGEPGQELLRPHLGLVSWGSVGPAGESPPKYVCPWVQLQ
jgi:hypothetical protein